MAVRTKKIADLPPIRDPVAIYAPRVTDNPEWSADRQIAEEQIWKSLEPEWGIGAYALAAAFGAALAKVMGLKR